VGGVIAFAVTSKGYGSVKWEKVGMIVASWFISPIMSGIVGCGLCLILKTFVLSHSDSMRRARMAAPAVVFFVSFVVALFTVYKGGKGVGLHKTSVELALAISAGIAVVLAALSYPFVNWWASNISKDLAEDAKAAGGAASQEEGTANTSATNGKANVVSLDEEPKAPAAAVEAGEVKLDEKVDDEEHSPTEQLFTGFVVIVAGFFSLAHGANDVANSVGPFGAVLAAFAGPLEKKSEIPIWVFIGAGAFIVLGLATYGIHVMKTIGNNITKMNPSKAFCVNFAATIVVLIATRLGIPVSTTHASVGAVVGVGMAQGVKEVNWKVMAKVFLSWVLTLPIVGITAAGIFALLLPCVVNVPFASPTA